MGSEMCIRDRLKRRNPVKMVSALSSLLNSSLTSSRKLSTEKKSLRRFAMLSFVTPLPSPSLGCYLLRVANEVSISGKIYRASYLCTQCSSVPALFITSVRAVPVYPLILCSDRSSVPVQLLFLCSCEPIISVSLCVTIWEPGPGCSKAD